VKRQTLPPTGWTAITPRIVTGIAMNQAANTSAFVTGLESSTTEIVAGHFATSAKVFISVTKSYFLLMFSLVLIQVDSTSLSVCDEA